MRTSSSRSSASATTPGSTTSGGCRSPRPTSDVAWQAAKDSVGSIRPPAEGAVGSGTGMMCLGFKGGIGTASRVVPSGHTVAVLLMTNFAGQHRSLLTVDGVPVGRLLPDALPGWTGRRADGSCIGLVVTDAPLDGASCERLARRVGLGLARTGSVAYHGSGEIFLAAATGLRADRDGQLDGTPLGGRALDPFFEAVVEATEEAVLNSMLGATTTVGRRGTGVARAAGGRRPGPARQGRARGGGPRDQLRRRRGRPSGPGRRLGADGRRRPPAVTLYLPDPVSRPAAVHPRGAALPQGRPDRRPTPRSTSGCATSTATRSPASTCAARAAAAAGRPTSTRRRSRRDLAEVIAWLAAQDWCDGNVGMYGTSYSGFNSLQMACERPPALKGVIAIYATDDRYTDDVHYLRWRPEVARPRRLLPLHDADERAPARARALGRRLARRVARRGSTSTSPGCSPGWSNATDGPYWRHGSVRPTTTASRCPTMIVAGWADGYRNNSFRTMEALGAQRRPAPPARRPVGARVDVELACPGPRIDLVPEMVRVVGPLAARRRERRRRRSRRRSGTSAAPTGPPPTSTPFPATGEPRSGRRRGRARGA